MTKRKAQTGTEETQPELPIDEQLTSNQPQTSAKSGANGKGVPERVPNEAVDDDFVAAVAANPDDVGDWIASSTPIVDTEIELRSIKVAKPGKQDFFRVHPTLSFPLYILLDTLAEETFLIAPKLVGQLDPEVLDMAKLSQAYFWIGSEPGRMGLWSVSLPDDQGKLNDWPRSAHSVAREAVDNWVKLRSNRAAGVYQIARPKRPEVFEGRDEWPDTVQTPMDLINLSFDGRKISELDHPLLQRLRGESA